MASLEEFLKDQGYRMHQSEDRVVLEKIKKVNIISIVVAVLGMSVFIFLGVVFTSAAALMYSIAALILLIVLRFNFRGFRPITVFDWTYKTMIRKSVYFFVNSVTVPIEGYQGINVKVKDLSASSSEGVDEFQKTVYLKTAKGEINVVDFYTDHEPIEPEIPMVMEAINDHLKKAS